MRYLILRFTSFLFFLILSTTFLFSQNNKVNWSSFNMGFAEVASSNLKVKSVAGQVFVGTVRRENTQVISGFLADTLLRSIPVSVEQVDELPTKFLLEQNFPNPFNPSTIIHFQLPVANWVTLKVYNILGQEVATLVDEHKLAGKYNIQFDGSQLSSGVYFYRLTTGDHSTGSTNSPQASSPKGQGFISTKKLLLVK